MLPNKEKTPAEIFSFAKEFKKSKNFIPLVSVPSTYSKVYEKDLIKNGFKLVIYANQLLRAAYPAMQYAAKTILDRNEARKKKMRLIIKRAIDQQELPPNTDAEICAHVILSFMNGLNAHAKSGATEQEMKRMCDFFIEKIGFVSLSS